MTGHTCFSEAIVLTRLKMRPPMLGHLELKCRPKMLFHICKVSQEETIHALEYILITCRDASVNQPFPAQAEISLFHWS